MIPSHRHSINLCGLRALYVELADASWLLGELGATTRSMVCCSRWTDIACSTACPRQKCIAVCSVLPDSSRGHSSQGPQPVLRLLQWWRRWGSTPQWAGLRALRLQRFERCAFRSNSLELAPCPCIALVLTARVPSTAAGFSFVITFEFGDRPRHYRWARDETRLACAARCLRWSLREYRTRDRSKLPRTQDPRQAAYGTRTASV